MGRGVWGVGRGAWGVGRGAWGMGRREPGAKLPGSIKYIVRVSGYIKFLLPTSLR